MMHALGLFAESPIYCVDLKVNPNILKWGIGFRQCLNKP